MKREPEKNKSTSPRRVTPGQVARWRELVDRGVPVTKIARTTGRNERTIRKYLRESELLNPDSAPGRNSVAVTRPDSDGQSGPDPVLVRSVAERLRAGGGVVDLLDLGRAEQVEGAITVVRRIEQALRPETGAQEVEPFRRALVALAEAVDVTADVAFGIRKGDEEDADKVGDALKRCRELIGKSQR